MARRSNRADRAGKGDSTKDNEIVARCWLPIDFDAIRPTGISATDEERTAAIESAKLVAAYLDSCDWPKPIVGDSGNGVHLLYRIELGVDDGGLVHNVLKALDARFSNERVKVDTSVGNPARIWKFYGTPVCKGEDMQDRPHRMARIVLIPDEIQVVPLSALEEVARQTSSEAPKPKRTIHQVPGDPL